MRNAPTLVLALACVAACSAAPSSDDVEKAFERAWKRDWPAMGRASGVLSLAETQPGVARGSGRTLRVAIDAAGAYAGRAAGQMAEQVVETGAGLAADFGAKPDERLRLSLAAWDVTNLKIIDMRQSGEEYVVRARYDLYAVNGDQRIRRGADVVQAMRLSRHSGEWMAAPIL